MLTSGRASTAKYLDPRTGCEKEQATNSRIGVPSLRIAQLHSPVPALQKLVASPFCREVDTELFESPLVLLFHVDRS